MTSSTRHRFRTDFRKLPDGTVVTMPGYGGSERIPEPDEVIELVDEEGNTCLALVDRLNYDHLIYAKPYWQTWRDGNEVERSLTDDLLSRLSPFHASVGDGGGLDDDQPKTAQPPEQKITVEL